MCFLALHCIYVMYEPYPPKPAIVKNQRRSQCQPTWSGTSDLSSITTFRPLFHLSHNEIFLPSRFRINEERVSADSGTHCAMYFSARHASSGGTEQASGFVRSSGAEAESQRRELTAPDLCFQTLRTVLISLLHIASRSMWLE